MKFPGKWFKKNLWAVFLFHQLVIFLSALGFLFAVRAIAGRSIHLGQDPVGLVDGTGLVILSVAVIAFTVRLYRWTKGKDAPPLGLAFSLARCGQLLAGLATGFVFAFLPWAVALMSGGARVADRIGSHFSAGPMVLTIFITFFLLLIQAVTEETANRAFPLRLWQHRALWFRILIPAIFFVAIHLAGEAFDGERVAILVMAGVLQSFAYLLTGNIWFGTGVHTGANYALYSVSGLWQAGAVVSLQGPPAFPNWVAVLGMTVVLGILYLIVGGFSGDDRERR